MPAFSLHMPPACLSQDRKDRSLMEAVTISDYWAWNSHCLHPPDGEDVNFHDQRSWVLGAYEGGTVGKTVLQVFRLCCPPKIFDTIVRPRTIDMGHEVLRRRLMSKKRQRHQSVNIDPFLVRVAREVNRIVSGPLVEKLPQDTAGLGAGRSSDPTNIACGKNFILWPVRYWTPVHRPHLRSGELRLWIGNKRFLR